MSNTTLELPYSRPGVNPEKLRNAEILSPALSNRIRAGTLRRWGHPRDVDIVPGRSLPQPTSEQLAPFANLSKVTFHLGLKVSNLLRQQEQALCYDNTSQYIARLIRAEASILFLTGKFSCALEREIHAVKNGTEPYRAEPMDTSKITISTTPKVAWWLSELIAAAQLPTIFRSRRPAAIDALSGGSVMVRSMISAEQQKPSFEFSREVFAGFAARPKESI